MAGRAKLGRVDLPSWNPRVFELFPRRTPRIEEPPVDAGFAREERRIVVRVGGHGKKVLREPLCSEASMHERLQHIRTNLVTTRTDSRTDGGIQIAGRASMLAPKGCDGGIRHVRGKATPAGVRRSDRTTASIDDQHRHTVR